MQNVMTDNQMRFITGLITELIGKCTTIEEVQEVNQKIKDLSENTKLSDKKPKKD